MAIYYFSAIALTLLLTQYSNGYISSGCVQDLPSFKDQGLLSPMLLVGIQALVPAYKLSCNGTLVRWRVATVRDGQHNIHLQVWRPNPKAGTYYIVGSNVFNLKPSKRQRLFTLTPHQEDQIRVQSGDVLGFYLEQNSSKDFSIQYQTRASGISVLYRQLSETIQTINHHTLPVELLNAAPIMQVKIDKEVTSSEATTSRDSTSTKGTTTEDSETNSFPTFSTTNPTSDPGENPPSLVISLILAITLGVTCLILIAIALVIGCKKKKGDKEESKKYLRKSFDDGDYEYTRAVIIPPPDFCTQTNMMFAAVSLRNNPIYESILTPSTHEYETPVLLSPTRFHAIPTSNMYDVPRGHDDYQNI